MTTTMMFAWIGGWAIPPAHLERAAGEAFPGDKHVVVYPGRHWRARLPPAADVFIGYSLGAFLVLEDNDALPEGATVVLLAPFLDIKAESGLGGAVSATQLKQLRRMMKRDLPGALDDFYARAGLPLRCDGRLPYPEEDLYWGIDRLLGDPVEARGLARVEHILAGADDPLIDAGQTAARFDGAQLIAGAGHGLADLLPHLRLG